MLFRVGQVAAEIRAYRPPANGIEADQGSLVVKGKRKSRRPSGTLQPTATLSETNDSRGTRSRTQSVSPDTKREDKVKMVWFGGGTALLTRIRITREVVRLVSHHSQNCETEKARPDRQIRQFS